MLGEERVSRISSILGQEKSPLGYSLSDTDTHCVLRFTGYAKIFIYKVLK